MPSSDSDNQHHGIGGFIQDHWKLLIIGTIVLLVVLSLFGLFRSSFWNLISNLFGAGAAAAAIAEDQLTKCFSSFVNFINPFSGCFIGIFAIGSGAIWLAAKIYSIKSSAEKPLVEQAKFTTGKNETELARSVLTKQKGITDEQITEQLKNKGITDPTKTQIDAARGIIANNGLAQETKNAIDSSSMSPTERQAATKNLIESNRVANEQVMEERNIPRDEAKDIDDTAREFEEPIEEIK